MGIIGYTSDSDHSPLHKASLGPQACSGQPGGRWNLWGSLGKSRWWLWWNWLLDWYGWCGDRVIYQIDSNNCHISHISPMLNPPCFSVKVVKSTRFLGWNPPFFLDHLLPSHPTAFELVAELPGSGSEGGGAGLSGNPKNWLVTFGKKKHGWIISKSP